MLLLRLFRLALPQFRLNRFRCFRNQVACSLAHSTQAATSDNASNGCDVAFALRFGCSGDFGDRAIGVGCTNGCLFKESLSAFGETFTRGGSGKSTRSRDKRSNRRAACLYFTEFRKRAASNQTVGYRGRDEGFASGFQRTAKEGKSESVDRITLSSFLLDLAETSARDLSYVGDIRTTQSSGLGCLL